MILPQKWYQRPRITLGQILASVAVASVPIALVMRSVRGSESTADFVVAALFSLVLTLLCEAFFWWFFVPLVPPLHRMLGRPSWFRWEVDVDPEGIDWVDDRRAMPTKPRDDGIRWME